MYAWIGLGSNLGDRLWHLRQAARALADIGFLRARSAIYETAAQLCSSATSLPEADRPYLNAALELETTLAPLPLLQRLWDIEATLGRVRLPDQRDAARPLDLDVLLLGRRGDVVMVSTELVVPHPRLHLRSFALRPLLDMAPALVHPALGVPLHVLYELLHDEPLHPLGWL